MQCEVFCLLNLSQWNDDYEVTGWWSVEHAVIGYVGICLMAVIIVVLSSLAVSE